MIINGSQLLKLEPIKDMATEKLVVNGMSYGLSEAGYDIRIKQEVRFFTNEEGCWTVVEGVFRKGRFALASAIEEFQMTENLVGIVHDKSSWARQGLSVFNTVIEPGFFGGLTLELVYHGIESLTIPAGTGIAQVIFHETSLSASYNGKYQRQSSNPEPARFE